MNQSKPIIVQGDRTILLDVHAPGFNEARQVIGAFAELEKSPEHIHTYRISSISLWNAAAAGITSTAIMNDLTKLSRFPIPSGTTHAIEETISRYGKLTMEASDDEDKLILKISDPLIEQEVQHLKPLKKYLLPTEEGFTLALLNRGVVKLELIKSGYPVEDLAPLREGDDLDISLSPTTQDGKPFKTRDYQEDAAEAFCGQNRPGNGFGVVVMPCGSGKTVVGMSVLAKLKKSCLIITTNMAAAHQWRDELIDKTTLTADDIGEYSGNRKEIKKVTIATYQILVWRKDKTSNFIHFKIFRDENWGLIIYDEVHLLPAPVFRITAELQAIKRLGLTATLVREDHAEENVFSLVGPKRYDIPWKLLEEQGWIATAVCHEIRLPLPRDKSIEYATADKRHKYRIAAENPLKIGETKAIIDRHPDDLILIIGQYIGQLKKIAKFLDAPLITGEVPNEKREEIYNKFRKGEARIIVVSKVANFAIDLPDASVAIQVSGSFGSRQEEAQRLGRILRPKKRSSNFYSLVSRFSVEETFAVNRQKFLAEQGYQYKMEIRE